MSTVAVVLIAATVLLVLFVLGALLAARLVGTEERALLRRIGGLPLRRKLALARGLASDPAVPLALRLLPVAMLVYLLLPFDLIPDFIPVLGQLDDVVLLGLALVVLLRYLPRGVIEARLTALEDTEPQ